MKNTLKINHQESKIIMDRTFAKLSENTLSAEYAHLQQVRRDYPNYTVVRREIKSNPNKETYAGLTYQYMRDYISTHVPTDKVDDVMHEFDELILISNCHRVAKRYPTIKKWFLNMFPEIVAYGIKPTEDKIMAFNREDLAEAV